MRQTIPANHMKGNFWRWSFDLLSKALRFLSYDLTLHRYKYTSALTVITIISKFRFNDANEGNFITRRRSLNDPKVNFLLFSFLINLDNWIKWAVCTAYGMNLSACQTSSIPLSGSGMGFTHLSLLVGVSRSLSLKNQKLKSIFLSTVFLTYDRTKHALLFWYCVMLNTMR